MSESDHARTCPSCRGAMTTHDFEKRLGGQLELDICFPCQGIWFDEYESTQLSPGSIIALFKLIQNHRDVQRLPLGESLHCPLCRDRLQHGLDRVKAGVFNYHRCLRQHGRFTTFAQFMTEKGFVRQLSSLEIDRLKANIGVIRCNSCGAPVDIKTDPVCGHCRSPMVVLDPTAVEQALAGYHQAEVRRTNVDPLAMADAIIEGERAKKSKKNEFFATPDRSSGPELGDLLLNGIDVVWSILRH